MSISFAHLMTPLRKGVFFSCIFPFRKLTGVFIHLTGHYFASYMIFCPDYGYYLNIPLIECGSTAEIEHVFRTR